MADFSIMNPGTVGPGDLSGSFSFNFTGVILEDENIVEADEMFTLHLPSQDTVDYTIGNITYVTIVIVNDDCKLVAF